MIKKINIKKQNKLKIQKLKWMMRIIKKYKILNLKKIEAVIK